ncbi:hypothetical protein SAMN05444351_0782 [Geodermatophilus nigrescens]|uniref:Uncharacterized protein n=1 Tax=Geodermatophilus nigrescens TaxID=1070870 RepID=A0A1M5EGC9_9ACTN|nr:hypothetical protein SAMN05444351_0782 [Geodermatophilus nigrescens]
MLTWLGAGVAALAHSRLRCRRHLCDFRIAARPLRSSRLIWPLSTTELALPTLTTIRRDRIALGAVALRELRHHPVNRIVREGALSIMGAPHRDMRLRAEIQPRKDAAMRNQAARARKARKHRTRNARSQRSVVLLRSFKDSSPTWTLALNLSALLAGARLTLVGSEAEGQALRDAWSQTRQTQDSFEQHIEFVAADEKSWRRHVVQALGKADCVILHLAPKGRMWPMMRFPRMRGEGFDDFFSAPLMELVAGPSVLHEIGYLEQLNLLPRTILWVHRSHAGYLLRLMAHALPRGRGWFKRVDATHVRALTPRLSARNRQVGKLCGTHGMVLHRSRDVKKYPRRSRSLLELRDQVLLVLAKDGRIKDHFHPVASDLIGRSPLPRRLPPDGQLKVIQFVNVEDLMRIPPFRISDVDPTTVLRSLSAETSALGCPSCRCPVEKIFFYTRDRESSIVRGRCQECEGYMTLEEDGTLFLVTNLL